MTTSSSSPGLRGRTLRSFLLLGAQKVVSVVVTAAGGIALARLLTPEVFGLYAILVFVITLGVRFSELGLGTALIQRRELELATGLSAAYTATFVLALVLGAAIVAAAPLLTRWPGVTSDVTARPTIGRPVTSFMSWNIVPFAPVTSATASDTDAG